MISEKEKIKNGYRHCYRIDFSYLDKFNRNVFTITVTQELSNPEWLVAKQRNIKKIFNLNYWAKAHKVEHLLCNGLLKFEVKSYIGFLRTKRAFHGYSNQNWVFKR